MIKDETLCDEFVLSNDLDTAYDLNDIEVYLDVSNNTNTKD